MNTHKASCFIEAMEGEEFEIHVESHSQVISVKLMIDGEVQVSGVIVQTHALTSLSNRPIKFRNQVDYAVSEGGA